MSRVIFRHSIFHVFGCFSPSFIVVYPLSSYCIAAFSWFKIKISEKVNNIFRLTRPKLAKFFIRQKFTIIKGFEGFVKGQPLDRFNSKYKFIIYSLFHHEWVFVDYRCNIQKNIYTYNLSVKNDDSYETRIGIVHNCRCMLIQLEDAKESDVSGFDFTEKEVPSAFRFNPAKKKRIYPKDHPYYEVSTKYRDDKNNNFNLPIRP